MGRYTQMRNRFTGFLCSGMMRPRTNSVISAGTSNTESMAPASHGKGLGVGKQFEQYALLRLKGEDQQEGTVMMEESQAESRPTLDGGLDQQLASWLFLVARVPAAYARFRS